MAEKQINRGVALLVFLVTITVYLRTLSTTVVFWDVGEFCAAARLMQVPHPPGSPLFLFLARIASLIPFRDDIAARMHAVSSIGSALAIMFLYLVTVKVIQRFRGPVQSMYDRLVTYGPSAVAAWGLAFSNTYWDNSIEAEVYGMGMFFVSAILWLALRWWEKADEPRNERYVLMIAYLLGLSTGVHILALLVTIPVMMLFYFRNYEVNRQTFFRFSAIALITFFVIYPGVVQLLPSFLDGDVGGVKSPIFPFVPLAVTLIAAYSAYKSLETRHKMLHIASLSFLLVVLGYTTYTQVIMRANVDNVPMNENRPNNLARLTSYLTREQYGQAPYLKGESWDNDEQNYVEKLFPRRYSREPMHEPTRVNYTSDMDFFWRYQVNHMYIRYVLWNFIGAEGDFQDAGVSFSDTFGIPFFIGLFGLWYHFKKDWKMGMVLLVMFTIMGIVLDLYQNQQDPQPRERDYFYVGAYYCMALWIGIGVYGIIEVLKEALPMANPSAMASGVLLLSLAAVPVNLARINWFSHDRSRNYVAWDYSYNLLQSCEKDGILFTNGDNDTFPLWYLQDVEGVRQDVRIVNLSLVNTPWYIYMLKNSSPHGARKIDLPFSNEQIERITPTAWKPQQRAIAVPRQVAEKFGVTDTLVLNQGRISFPMNGVPYQQDIRILRVQDIMVYSIITSIRWDRPIYFAVTCSPDSKIGLDNYLWMEGLSFRLKPIKTGQADQGLDYDIMASNVLADHVAPVKTPQWGYLYRNLNDQGVYYDENVQRMVQNYRFNFMRLAQFAMNAKNDRPRAKQIFGQMEKTIPVSVIPMQDWRISAYFMTLFTQLGDTVNFNLYAKTVEPSAMEAINSGRVDAQDPFMPYRTLLDIYDSRKDYRAAVDLLNRALALYPNTPEIKSKIQSYEQKIAGTAKDTAKVQ